MPHVWIRIGDDVRRLRVEAGVSLRELAAATGIDASYLARIEKYRAHPSLPTLTSISVALGADLSLRFYGGKGPRIHDRSQAPMIDTLLRSLAPCWMPRLEVVVPPPTRGVVDVVLTDRQRPVLVIGEAQSEFRRIEQQLRWIARRPQHSRPVPRRRPRRRSVDLQFGRTARRSSGRRPQIQSCDRARARERARQGLTRLRWRDLACVRGRS
jgi:transcriptional regulator with XRE-family HTH domain